MDYAMTEADFDRAVALIEAEQGDPLAPLLSGGRLISELAIDVEGRVEDLRKVIKKNCYCLAACALSGVCTICVLCKLCGEACEGNQSKASCDGESEDVPRMRTQASAHHLKLTDEALVYTRDAHVGTTTKNFVAYDQYGHRFPGMGESQSNVAGTTLHIPLQHATLERVPLTEISAVPTYADPQAAQCCDMTPSSSVLVVRVGEGVRIVVACVEVGPGGNVEAFVRAFEEAKKRVNAETPELAGAYNAWFGSRLSRSGTMAGAAPRRNQTMDRGGVAGQVGQVPAPFIRAVGPLPPQLGVVKNTMQANRMLHFAINKDTYIHSIHGGPFVNQLNGEDRLLSVNGVSVPGQATQQFLDQAQAASPPGGGGFMQVQTMQPHFQPIHMLTVGPMPAGAIGSIQFDANRTPPTVLQPDEPAAKSGLLKGDIVLQAVIDGATHNTNSYTGQQFVNMANPAQQTTITVLQTHRLAPGNHELPWVALGAMKP